MQTEIEATFLDVDKNALREKLKAAGAELVQPELLMKRTIFNLTERSFVRVRDEGNKITLSYKCLESLTLSGMKEICVEVDDYEKTVELMKTCGLEAKAVQETYREEWELGGAEITIDTWPWMPTYCEIEGASEELVATVASKLGFEMKDAHYGSSSEMYQAYYDIDVREINTWPEIKFTEVPEWLEKKRRTKH